MKHPSQWLELIAAVSVTRSPKGAQVIVFGCCGARFGAALGPPHMAAYQLRRCAQELADAERAQLLSAVRPAALPAERALDSAAELARGQAAAALPNGSENGRSGKRRRLPEGHEAGHTDDGEGPPCAGGADLQPAETGGRESGEGACADGRGSGSCDAGRGQRRLVDTGGWGSGGSEHAGTLSAREERAVALLALAASDAPVQGAAVPAAAPPDAAGDACGPDALKARGMGPIEAHPPAATPARGPPHVPAGAGADAAGCGAGLGKGLGLAADATRVLAALSPAAVRRVLGALAGRFPRSTAALLGGALPPAAAELLIARLEAADAELAAAGVHAEL